MENTGASPTCTTAGSWGRRTWGDALVAG
jgi:hypothetical protein